MQILYSLSPLFPFPSFLQKEKNQVPLVHTAHWLRRSLSNSNCVHHHFWPGLISQFIHNWVFTKVVGWSDTSLLSSKTHLLGLPPPPSQEIMEWWGFHLLLSLEECSPLVTVNNEFIFCKDWGSISYPNIVVPWRLQHKLYYIQKCWDFQQLLCWKTNF